MLNVAVKERLEKYMKEAGVSQAKIAPLIGVSMTALRSIEVVNTKAM